MVYWVVFRNDDVGPFASRELAETTARLECGDWSRLGDSASDDWAEDAEVFASDETRGLAPIVAIMSPSHPSQQVAWFYATH